MSKLNRWLQSTALTISLCSTTAFAEDVSQHLQRLYMWEAVANTCIKKAPKELEQDWKFRATLLFVEIGFWENSLTSKLRYQGMIQWEIKQVFQSIKEPGY
ncbi:hypothetical protein [Shewanella dokdonensis]|uniref:Uncharacterized protein n=1 Tax=Shewanella dokdonensis TaxID=712036 RepID=A0ABX8DEK8_9GAMM|nr:hypothetical protein [Shewanella dokdonensis]MCL1073016.1 hypothetical protein [Shewanella dokdonensis]QVK23071.1 hypothetical protein KHX94_18540 [Shewanella dokdonensis]